ncbi:hypothetical protein EDB85DRAFT_1900731 [Lactarius pseudohatsudake]|nr:hypothetical protein EDB85DRAFT_1900731 [Lactarius pseudohatsudake]
MCPSTVSICSIAPGAQHHPSAEKLAGLNQKKKEAELSMRRSVPVRSSSSAEGLGDDCEAMANEGAGARPFPSSDGFHRSSLPMVGIDWTRTYSTNMACGPDYSAWQSARADVLYLQSWFSGKKGIGCMRRGLEWRLTAHRSRLRENALSVFLPMSSSRLSVTIRPTARPERPLGTAVRRSQADYAEEEAQISRLVAEHAQAPKAESPVGYYIYGSAQKSQEYWE